MEKVLREDIENLMMKEEIMWAQKARSTWIIQGDRNTTFFQTLVKQRRARNRILQIRTDDGSQLKELEDIEYYMMEHFKKQYSETSTRSVQELMKELENLEVLELDSIQRIDLDRPVSNKEIEMVAFQLGPQKSPSPNGILAFFYEELWSIVRQYIFNYVHTFFHSSTLLISLNQTYIALIPKIKTPKEVAHFRSISLCNVTYKIISKFLVTWLKPFMDTLITPYQKAFIQGRTLQATFSWHMRSLIC